MMIRQCFIARSIKYCKTYVSNQYGWVSSEFITIQQKYYQLIGSKCNGQKWGELLVGKVLRATHLLWLYRNDMLHVCTEHDIPGIDMVQLRGEIEK